MTILKDANDLATEKEGASTVYLTMIALVASVGGFLFGYDLSLISGAIIFLKEEFALSPFWSRTSFHSAATGESCLRQKYYLFSL